MKTRLRELFPAGRREPGRRITHPSLHLLAEYCTYGIICTPLLSLLRDHFHYLHLHLLSFIVQRDLNLFLCLINKQRLIQLRNSNLKLLSPILTIHFIMHIISKQCIIKGRVKSVNKMGDKNFKWQLCNYERYRNVS